MQFIKQFVRALEVPVQGEVVVHNLADDIGFSWCSARPSEDLEVLVAYGNALNKD